MPRVSVIIPTYNRRAYVQEAIDSVLAQTCTDYEIIVVDDGSTDGTGEVLRERYGSLVVYAWQENQGVSAARNAAIRACTGEFVALLDSDDLWLPRKLERQMAAFEQHPDTALVYSFGAEIDEKGFELGSGGHLGQDLPEPDRPFESLLQGCWIPALTAVFRRECLTDVGYFDEGLVGAADWDMWLKIAERWPVVCVPEVLARYRVHAVNMTKMLYATRRAVEEDLAVLNRYLDESLRRQVASEVAGRARAILAHVQARIRRPLTGSGRLAG